MNDTPRTDKLITELGEGLDYGDAAIAQLCRELEREINAAHHACDGMAIRNEKDGYPGGRADRELTLVERIYVMRKMILDYQRWLDEAEKKLATYPALEEVCGPEFEGLDTATDVLRVLKAERDSLRAELDQRNVSERAAGVCEQDGARSTTDVSSATLGGRS